MTIASLIGTVPAMVDVSKLGWLPEDVPSNMKLINAEIERLNAEMKAALALQKATQEICPHPKEARQEYYDQRERDNTHCTVCDKWW